MRYENLLPAVPVRDFRFYRDHSARRAGHVAEGAIEYARAMRMAEDAGYTFDWEDDDIGYEVIREDAAMIPTDEGRRRYLAADHEVLGCTMRAPDGTPCESLWGISDPDGSYRRVIEAELCLEHFGAAVAYASALAYFMARI